MFRRPHHPPRRGRWKERGASTDAVLAMVTTVVLATAMLPVLGQVGDRTADGDRGVVCRVFAFVTGTECADEGVTATATPTSDLAVAADKGAGKRTSPQRLALAEEVTKRVTKAPPAAVQQCLDGGREYLAGIRELGIDIVRQMLSTELQLLPPGEAFAPAWEDVRAFLANPFDYKTALKDPARWFCAQVVSAALTGGGGRLAGAARTAPRTILRDAARRKPALRRLLPDCRPNSFLPQTRVLLADGTTTPISRVRVGTRVLAADPETGARGSRPVTAVIERTGLKDLVDLTVGGHRVTATASHPFWVPATRTWVDAGDLADGDRLQTRRGGTIALSDVRARSARVTVNNLTVGDLHTYYVLAGDTPLLVHNADCNPPKPPNRPNPPRRPDGDQAPKRRTIPPPPVDADGFVTLYKAPQRGRSQQQLRDGYRPEDFPRDPSGFGDDGKAYFARDRSLAEQYANSYGDGIIEVKIPLAEYNARYRRYEHFYEGGDTVEVVIPYEEFGDLNRHRRRLVRD